MLLGSNLKKQISISEKQNQELGKVHGLNKTVLNKKCENSDLLYNNLNLNIFSITDVEFNDLSDDTKYKHLQRFFKIK